MRFSIRAVTAATLLAAGTAATATPSFVNGLALDGGLLDLSAGTDFDRRVGYFSDIYYDPNAKAWWGLSDRGPGGGSLPYSTRAQRFTLDVDQTSGAISNFKIVETVIFKSGGQFLNFGYFAADEKYFFPVKMARDSGNCERRSLGFGCQFVFFASRTACH